MTVDRQSRANDRSVQAIEELRRLLPDDAVSDAQATREQHGTDESWHLPTPPDAVVYPGSTEEVAGVVRICAALRVPVIAFGAGTSLEGHVAALKGGISLDTSRLNHVREVNLEDLDCLVEAGVHRVALNERLRREGVFFPVDPGADATIGGMASTRASGTTTVRYGTMRENVLGLTVVLSDGRVIRTGGRARKSSAGYDLTRLFVGAEGTLGVITEIRLRIYPVPDVIAAAVCGFPSVSDAVEASIECIQLGIPVARIELLNQVQMAASNRRSDLGLPERPTLFIELHGGEAAVEEAAEAVETVTESHQGTGFEWTTDPKERDRLWTARHQAYYAALALRPGARALTTDVCVPISRLAECIAETERDLDGERALAPIVGHVGDGNFHVVYLFDPLDGAELARAREFHERLVHRALAMGGTCTGEHGIGHGKLAFMREEHADAVATMSAIKAALDPYGIMNPGKVVPAEASSARAVVLVEGISDQRALEALAERRGRNLEAEGISIVPIGGATNIGSFLHLLGPQGLDVRLAGLCDVAEEGDFRRGLERAGLGSNLTRADMESLGFYVCVADLEDELIRSLGVASVERIVDAQGELGSFRTLQKQPAQQGRSAEQQLRRFMGTRGGRKIQYAPLLVQALDLTRVPRPLDGVLAHV